MAIDAAQGSMRQIAALDLLWEGVVAPDVRVVREPACALSFVAAVRRLVDAEIGSVSGEVTPTHGAMDGIAHALAGVEPDSGVYFEAGTRTWLPILRSGHRPLPIDDPADAPPGAVVVARSDVPRASLVVVDNSFGFLDSHDLAPAVARGALVVDSLSYRLGAPGLRLGWVFGAGSRSTVAAESAAAAGGVAAPALAMGAAALHRSIELGTGPAVADEISHRWSVLRDAVDAVAVRDRLWARVLVDEPAAVAGRAGAAGVRTRVDRGGVAVCLGACADVAAVAAALNAALR